MGKIDFHCHLLPGADHGSRSVDESLAQLKLLQAAGIDRVVATPHYYPDYLSPEAFLYLRSKCAESLAASMPANSPAVYLGAEVLICQGLEDMDVSKLCIEGTNTLLLEMPFSHFTDKLLYTVEMLTKQDIVVVMAHIDRYDEDDVRELMCLPVLAQVNIASIARRGPRIFLEEFFAAGRIVALGTDLHGHEDDALKGYRKGLRKLGAPNEANIYETTGILLRGAQPINKN